MRVNWAIPLVMVALLAMSALPASACIPGMPEQEFEAQAVSCGTAFLEVTLLSMTTVDELFPQSITFRDAMYVTWQREEFNETVTYYVTLESFDGTEWSDPIFLSSPDINEPIRSQLNLNPRMGANDEALYVVWTSNERNWTNGIDDDVVFRYTEDGETWSEVIEVTGHYNTGLDKLARVVPLKDKVWFVWETNDRMDSDGGDMDIIMRSWDGHDLGQVIEVTPPGDVYNDHHVMAAADDDNMYITWMKKNYTSGANVYDVWGRIFDGSDWVTPPVKLSSDAVANNEHPSVVAGDGRGYFMWETYDTGRIGDLTSIVMREWSEEEGFGRRVPVSSLTSNGKDSKPSGLWYRDSLFIAWISSDQGVTFGMDPDLVYRVGRYDDGGQLRFDDFIEVSTSTDDYMDRSPTLVAYDDIVNVVWAVDTNYTELLPPEVLEPLGGFYRNPDVAIQSIDIPFEKQLGLVYTLGTAFPIATKATTAQVTVTDLQDMPMEDLRVGLRFGPAGTDPSSARFRFLEERGDGVYALDELEFAREGTHELVIIVNDVEAGAFVVDVVPPPPSFLDRVPMTSIAFIAVGIITGVVLYRMMGRDDLVYELRPVPLDLAIEVTA